MKKIYQLLMLLLIASTVATAQNNVNIFDPKVPITWLGLDFSETKIIGEQDHITEDAKLIELIAAWNDLMIKEASKYNVTAAFHKEADMVADFTATNQNNSGRELNGMLLENSDGLTSFSSSTIQRIVNRYNFNGLSGLGLMIVVEKFDKPGKKGVLWYTIINMDTRAVLFTEMLENSPGGFGVRNFWASPVYATLERIKKKEYNLWRIRKEATVDMNQSQLAVVNEKPKEIVQSKKEVASANQSREDTRPSVKQTPVAANRTSVKPGGQFYALLIGVSKYNDPRLDLDHPVSDAYKMKETLSAYYDFPASNITVLENPTRGDIFSALYKLRSQVTLNDNLLLFYAGHGFWDENIKQGYWWPKDATTNDPSNWLSNSDLREQLRGINSAHTLLVSDACFSGGIFRTRDASAIKSASIDYQLLYKMPSRRAITSGTLTAVPDRSVFVEYFIKRLKENKEQFLPSQQLFGSLRLAVINNSATVPQQGVIAETGDEGGDFIFIKKTKNK